MIDSLVANNKTSDGQYDSSTEHRSDRFHPHGRTHSHSVGTPARFAEERVPMTKTKVAVAAGDGIGPEITAATLRLLEFADAPLEFLPVEMGKAVYLGGCSSGISDAAWETLRQTKLLLKAPITTPQGGGYKSLNVTLRKSLGLFANVRPCRSYSPFVPSQFPQLNLTIIRENEEDTYGGIEHQQTDEVVQCLKLITRPGCERIVRYAFEYASLKGHGKVTCMTKDNIMKLTDGLFRKVFEEIAQEYPQIKSEHMIVDIGAARMATRPEDFEVIVLPNLYGDILSDIAAQMTGSVGLAGSANIGERFAMFEAIHGSAPDIAGKGIANPSGLLLSAVMLLQHLNHHAVAARLQNAWLATLEQGIHTRDIFRAGVSQRLVSTTDFCSAICDNLGNTPKQLTAVAAPQAVSSPANSAKRVTISSADKKTESNKELDGIDVFLHWRNPEHNRSAVEGIAAVMKQVAGIHFTVSLITNRGVKVWPQGFDETFCTDHWRVRFNFQPHALRNHRAVVELLQRLADRQIDFIKTEHLYRFDGERRYSLGQGE